VLALPLRAMNENWKGGSMPYKARFKKLAVNSASLVFHFAHGGLLITGFVVILLGVGYYNGSFELSLRSAPAAVPPVRLEPVAIETASLQQTALKSAALKSEEALPTNPLKPAMRAVVNDLARRYHVSSQAIEPLVLAAQIAGARVNLDPLLILAVVAIESRFNPFAESVVGAQGLMQIIPKYHQDKIDAAGSGKNALLDPHTNIQVGVRVLKESIQRAGSLEAGLQQYAGAPDDSDAQYASKVMAEKQRLEQAVRLFAAKRTRQADASA
jgi:soluble lytic murein transglycosylase-like protein